MLLVAVTCVGTALAGMAPISVAVVAFMALALTIGIGVSVPSSGVFARPILSVRTDRSELALTFDDGPDPRWTPPLLDLLEAHGQRATFFVVGKRAERYAGLVAEISRRGHEIGNHTWAHSRGTVFVAPHQLARELQRANTLIERSTGVRPRWFRPPVGLLSPRIQPAVHEAGLQLVGWTASARDGVRSTTAAEAFARLEKSIVPGAILVLHDAAMYGDREPIARELLQLVLDRMESAGVRSVTLSGLCSAHSPGPVTSDSTGNHGAGDRPEENAKGQPANRPSQ
jgi:peptidoglycan/xylan/chitin deacetylase (PgdA/CDA1 family)